ncbi:beta-N-acetylhexosaminidase [Arcicella rigui]|uniref:beta-N-acetylhexosaminidase n=1 Tax=Arcicella rigui TaxID=797020 RepID=A0ABU5QEE6_9BACT|nr:family 20 glycosylhydrolase [Arcicella rigui]MEA5141221.1 family 20 glycosylhydrolase [Arcicella rigui]
MPKTTSFLIIFLMYFFTSNNPFAQSIDIIPKPVSVVMSQEKFTLNSATSIILPSATLRKNAQFLQEALHSLTPFSFPILENTSANFILISIDTAKVAQKEGYQLSITKNEIKIIGHDEAGVFYGIQSLIQVAYQAQNKGFNLAACRIEDYPRFPYRGLHLDVGRHFFPISFLKKYIDLLAFYKINTFHWHLTDDQGWRIEIKKYPHLQSVAAFRNETIIGHKKDFPHRFDGKKYGGFYSQDEVKSLVKYASEKYVNVIPEIEMPGHASAALAAYPHLGCVGASYKTATFWGVFDDVFCAGNDSTFTFLQDVLSEILPLFPSKYIHIGGDECPKARWKVCPKCQKRMKDEHLADEHELQSYFIRKIEKFLNAQGREIIGWDEILEGGLSPNASVMSWRGEAGGIAAAKQKHNVIMTPESHLYLDYYQSLHADEPTAAASFTPLSKVYSYEPFSTELNHEDEQYIKGVQANIWTEYTPQPEQVEYMVFPRALALSEIAWSPKTHKNYADFLSRLRQHRSILQQKKVNFFDRFEEITYHFSMEKSGKSIIHFSTTLPNAKIHYTVDGKTPTPSDKVFKNQLIIDKSTTLKAQIFVGKNAYGKVFEQAFEYHKAVAKNVILKHQPKTNYNPDKPFALTNGLTGNARYNNSQWVGFSGEDLEATIDLESMQSISKVGLNLLKYHWQRMWEPNVLIFLVSEDGIAYKEVYRTSNFPANGINQIRAKITPTKARFIKVQAENKGIIPAGEYGAGVKAWLLIDEIYVE